MKKIIFSMLLGALCAVAAAAQASTATPAPTTPGAVSRVIYYHTMPGKAPDVTNFVRTHQMPILEEQKKQGLILAYGFFNQPVNSGPTDWNLGVVITYKNYADAIDANPEREAKFEAISLANYGSADARTKATDALMAIRSIHSSVLVRAVNFNPMPK